MKRLSRTIKTNYDWHRTDNEPIKEEHIEALDETALDEIHEMQIKGFVSGELFDNIRMTDADGEDGIEYKGWWHTDCEEPTNLTEYIFSIYSTDEEQHFEPDFCVKKAEAKSLDHLIFEHHPFNFGETYASLEEFNANNEESIQDAVMDEEDVYNVMVVYVGGVGGLKQIFEG